MIIFFFSATFPTHDFQAFENEWVEVEVKQPIEYTRSIEFLMEHLTLPESLKHDANRNGWFCNFILNKHNFVNCSQLCCFFFCFHQFHGIKKLI